MPFLKDQFSIGSILFESVSQIRKLAGETVVVKYGGSAMGSIDNMKNFAKDIVLLKQCGVEVIVVHGAGPQLGQILGNLNIKTSFIDGLRISTKENIDVVEMILSGHINKQIVHEINLAGGLALGFSGKDANLMMAKKVRKTYKETDSNIERILDFGYVGMPAKINTEVFEIFNDTPIIPVISPVGFDENGATYNVNADNVAGAIAGALRANKLVLLTEFDGIMGTDGAVCNSLSKAETEMLVKDKAIKGSLLPKVDVSLEALALGVASAHIINSSAEHGLIRAILTKSGFGTMIFNNEINTNAEEFDFDE